ncbi:MAG: putative peptidoglycan-binding domain-containing protein [Balneolaceae bacterium]
MRTDYRKLVPFVLRWEGGIANDPDDSGGLTNKGITFSTFKSLAKKVLGKEPTKDVFLSMTANDAALFVKHFWDKATNNNSINSQKVAEAITTWFWGSGGFGLMEFQRLLNEKFNAGLKVDGAVGIKTVTATNKINPDKLFIEMIKARKKFFEDLAKERPKDAKFLQGWLNRLNDFYSRHKTESDPTLALLGVLAFATVVTVLINQ